MVPKYDPTRPAKQVWKYLYTERWPKLWRVKWAKSIKGGFGQCFYEVMEIHLDWREASWDHGHCVADLIHEFRHLMFPTMEHGAEFEALVTKDCGRLGIENSYERRSHGKGRNPVRATQGAGKQTGVGSDAG